MLIHPSYSMSYNPFSDLGDQIWSKTGVKTTQIYYIFVGQHRDRKATQCVCYMKNEKIIYKHL